MLNGITGCEGTYYLYESWRVRENHHVLYPEDREEIVQFQVRESV